MGWRDKKGFKTFGAQQDEQEYVYIQWLNDGQALDPRQQSGGFFLPHDQPIFEQRGLAPEDVALPGIPAVRHFKSGSKVEGVFAPYLDLAVTVNRFRWEKGRGTEKEYIYNAPYPGIGWRGKTQILALAQGGKQPFYLLTFSGWPGTHFLEALAKHETQVKADLAQAGDTTSRPPAWVFFGRYVGGDQEMVGNGQKSTITRITYDPAGFSLDDRYIGDQLAEIVEGEITTLIEWQNEWDTQQEEAATPNTTSNAAPCTAPKATPRTAPKASESATKTATQVQWQTIRSWLTQLGYVDDARRNNAIIRAGYDPTRLSVEDANALIDRLKKAPAPETQKDRVSKLLTQLGYAQKNHETAIRKAGYDLAALTLKQSSDLIARLQKAAAN